MNEQGRILDMLAEGKITAEEAERLLEALRPAIGWYTTLVTPPEPAHESDGSGSTDADEVVNLSYRNAQETFTVGDSPKLVVGNTNGTISVRAGQPNETRAEAKVPSSLKDKYQVTQESNTVIVQAEASGQKVHGIFSIFGTSLKVHVDVTVPPNTSVELTNKNGRIELSGAEGTAKLTNKNGSIELTGTRGTVEIESKNGKLSAQDCGGEIMATSKNGRVVMNGVNGVVNLKSRNGAITLRDFDGQVDATTKNGRITFSGKFDAGTKNRLVTKNSAIDADLSAVADLKLDAETKLGKVTYDLPNLTVTNDSGRSVLGTLGEGNTELVHRSNIGRISVC